MQEERRNCVCCNHSLLRRRYYQLLQQLFDDHPGTAEHIQGLIAPRQLILNGEHIICRNCWLRVRYAVDRRQNQDEHNVPPPRAGRPTEGFFVTNEYTRAPNTSNSCIYYECGNDSRCRIPASIKLELLVHSNYYIPLNARVCQNHLEQNQWDLLIDAPNSSHDFTGEMFIDITKTLQTAIINNPNTMDFENIEVMDPTILQHRVGLTHDGFEQVIRETPSLALEVRQPNKALAIYLMKLRTGESNERLGVLFRMSRPTLERNMNIVRKCLLQDFVPRHLGLDHISRNEVVAKNLSVPNGLYGSPNAPLQERKAVVVIDGTYVYVQKSSNFLFQRKTYSLHKYTNLLKPFLIVCCDGYIIDVTGPHAATTSDSVIMGQLIDENPENPFHYFFNTDDVFICDRGFRDVIEDMESCGYVAHIPISKRRGEDQLTTLEANKNREVTICRWVVELVNGRFKRDFRLFRQDFFNRAMSHMMDDFRVAAAVINAFHVLLEDSVHASEFLRIITERMHEPNRLGAYVTERNVNRQRASFRNIEADVIGADEFPVLTHQDLVLFALGTYHVKLARSYYAEHIRNGVYHIEVARDGVLNNIVDFGIEPEHAMLLRARIQSRHARSRLYYTAPVHIVTGSAGCQEGRDHFLNDEPKWSAFRSQDFGYTEFKAFNKTHIHMQQVSVDLHGKVIDAFWLVKDKITPHFTSLP